MPLPIDPARIIEAARESMFGTEDIGFCINAGEKGYDIWCDSRVKLGHISKDRPIISEETYEETNTVPIAMSRQLEVDTIYSCAS